MTAKERVIAEALKLTEAERLEVAEQIYESLGWSAEEPTEAAWAAEIQRRVREIDSGTARMLTKEEAERIIMGEDDDIRRR